MDTAASRESVYEQSRGVMVLSTAQTPAMKETSIAGNKVDKIHS